MISDFFINLGYYGLSFFAALFPLSAGFPAEVQTAFTWLGGYIGILDPLVPVSTLLTCVSIIFSVELAILSFRILSWVYSKIPFIGK